MKRSLALTILELLINHTSAHGQTKRIAAGYSATRATQTGFPSPRTPGNLTNMDS